MNSSKSNFGIILMIIGEIGCIAFFIALKCMGYISLGWLWALLFGTAPALPIVGGCGVFIVLKLFGVLSLGWVWILVPAILGGLALLGGVLSNQ